MNSRGTALAEMAGVNLPPQIPVAVFLTRFEPGGTERQMIELVRRLDPSRFRVHVACFEKSGAWLPRVEARAASIAEFPIRGFARAATAARMVEFARWCRRERIAVVQTCDLYANIFGLPAAAAAGVPVRIASRRELNPDKSRGQILLQRQAYRFATKVVANSRAAQAILQQEGLATSSIVVIPNGIDPSALVERRPDVADRAPRTIITVANLRAEKSHETLIAAAARLVRIHPHLQFQIVGGGPRRQALEALAAAHAIRDHVAFLGYREDVGALLAAADIFVLPSRSEAFPNGAIEAMAAGLPVVASAVGGLLDLIEDGRTGLLVPPAEPQALAAAIGRLIEDRALARRLGEQARTHVAERYTFERMVQAFEDLYLAGLPARAPSGAHHAEAAGI
jgi:glycosyltransferase involved in cell wall biosynthesis